MGKKDGPKRLGFDTAQCARLRSEPTSLGFVPSALRECESRQYLAELGFTWQKAKFPDISFGEKDL